jgi:hypothetical protein
MRKNILLPAAFFTDVCQLIRLLRFYELSGEAQNLCISLKSQIKDKLDAMDRHTSFSNYKSAAPNSSERELHRREYLDKAGLHRNWISDDELSLPP